MTNNGWISVEDRLPEDGKYLCCFSSLGLGWCIDVLSASDTFRFDDAARSKKDIVLHVPSGQFRREIR